MKDLQSYRKLEASGNYNCFKSAYVRVGKNSCQDRKDVTSAH